MYGPARSHRRVAMALGSLLVTLVFLSVNRETATMHDALLQEEAGSSALRQMRLVNVAPMMEETPGWMGFRSSIDGFNVNQHPSTGPGGAQDHQDPVYYSNGRWPTGSGATIARLLLSKNESERGKR